MGVINIGPCECCQGNPDIQCCEVCPIICTDFKIVITDHALAGEYVATRVGTAFRWGFSIGGCDGWATCSLVGGEPRFLLNLGVFSSTACQVVIDECGVFHDVDFNDGICCWDNAGTAKVKVEPLPCSYPEYWEVDTAFSDGFAPCDCAQIQGSQLPIFACAGVPTSIHWYLSIPGICPSSQQMEIQVLYQCDNGRLDFEYSRGTNATFKNTFWDTGFQLNDFIDGVPIVLPFKTTGNGECVNPATVSITPRNIGYWC